jgi:hypothetical protein
MNITALDGNLAPALQHPAADRLAGVDQSLKFGNADFDLTQEQPQQP